MAKTPNQMYSRPLLVLGAIASLAAAFVLLLAAGLPQRAAYSGEILPDGQIVAPEIGASAPSFLAPTLSGVVDLSELRGTPVVINFWATWCVPCRVEMPELQALHAAQPTVRVLAVNLGEPLDLIVDWVTHFGLTFEIVLDAEQTIAAAYRLRGQPSTYVISPKGVVTAIFYGPTTQEALEAALEPFLRG